jgi:hypothetical protein
MRSTQRSIRTTAAALILCATAFVLSAGSASAAVTSQGVNRPTAANLAAGNTASVTTANPLDIAWT